MGLDFLLSNPKIFIITYSLKHLGDGKLPIVTKIFLIRADFLKKDSSNTSHHAPGEAQAQSSLSQLD